MGYTLFYHKHNILYIVNFKAKNVAFYKIYVIIKFGKNIIK